MREENIQRLSGVRTGLSDPTYLIYKFLFRDLQDAISMHARGDVLDIGCGNKPYEQLFTGGGRYVGCDIVQSSGNRVDVICDVTNIPLEDGQFDTVFSTQVLEHVADHQKMLNEAYRLLRPGGKIILSAPMAWEHHEMPYDFFRFTRSGMEYIFEKAGFKVIKIKANGGKWAFIGQLRQNVMMSSGRGKGALKPIIRIAHKLVLKYYLNLKYSLLERLDKDEDFVTLNFVVVAEKNPPDLPKGR